MYICSYCSKEFSEKYRLNKHQRTAKYCLAKQEQSHKCEHCGNLFSTNYNLRKHQRQTKSCHTAKGAAGEIERIKTEHQQELDHLKSLIDGITGKIDPKDPTINVQQMESVTIGKIADAALEHLDIEDLQRGIEAIVEFTASYPLKNRVICMDRARRKFKYVNEVGNTVIDYGGLQLSQTVFQGIQERCTTLIDAKYLTMMAEVQMAVKAEEGYRDDVWEIMKAGSDLQDIKLQLNAAASGVENEFQRSFVRKLAQKL